jgi:CIC family chloride channel protein
MKNTPLQGTTHSPGATLLLALRWQYAAALRRLNALPSKRRYFVTPVLIGVITGVLALLFVKLINLFNRLFLEDLVGYDSPHAAGGFFNGASGLHPAMGLHPGRDTTYSAIPRHPWILPVCLGLAGLVSGLIAKYVARRARGLGTDVAISAYHHDPADLSLKDSFAKLFTSALVLGAGGPSGREGAMSLIGGAVGATVAKLLRQSHAEMREALAIGVGAGLGAMFKAPLAGAIISAELFYRHDFEIETILPAFVAGSIAYVIVAMKTGFSPLIATSIPVLSVYQIKYLLWFSVFGLFSALIVRVMLGVLDAVRGWFQKRKSYPIYIKAMLGGILAGLVGMVTPFAIGNGYGWLQLLISSVIHPSVAALSLGMFGVILGMALIAGSGASGGAFSPTVVIGGLAGALFGHLVMAVDPASTIPISMFIIVGMMTVFAGAAKAPLSTLILITEMTGSYELLVPAMLSIGMSVLFSGKRNMFSSQHERRDSSTPEPAITGGSPHKPNAAV